MLNLKHKNLIVWQKAFELNKMLYKLTKYFPKEEIFVLVSQIRRASISVVSNIAEGSARKSSFDRKRFYEISRSSLVEIDTQLEISIDLGYIPKNELTKLDELLNYTFAMLSKLIENTK